MPRTVWATKQAIKTIFAAASRMERGRGGSHGARRGKRATEVRGCWAGAVWKHRKRQTAGMLPRKNVCFRHCVKVCGNVSTFII